MRVMRVLTRPNLGGPTRQAIALWHALGELGATTLLVSGVVDAGETLLSPADHGVPRLSRADAVAAGERAMGWVELPELRRGPGPLRDRRALAALRELVRSFRPEIVHTHTSKAGWLGRTAARAAPGARLVHTFHGHVLQDYFPAPLAWWLRRLERRLASRTDQLIAVSASCADELAAAGVAPRERFLVVPPAVPIAPLLTRGAARARLGVGPDERRIACVGRLVPIKRVEHFLQALARLDGVHGDVVGDGPSLAALQTAGGPAGRVHFRGALPDIAACLPAYDALVLPSVREGLPLVAVEAFRAGVPVVGYDVPGVRDALAAGRGVLVPVAAGPAGLAEAVRDVLARPAAARHAAADDPFLPSVVARTLWSVYRALLAGRGALP